MKRAVVQVGWGGGEQIMETAETRGSRVLPEGHDFELAPVPFGLFANEVC